MDGARGHDTVSRGVGDLDQHVVVPAVLVLVDVRRRGGGLARHVVGLERLEDLGLRVLLEVRVQQVDDLLVQRLLVHLGADVRLGIDGEELLRIDFERRADLLEVAVVLGEAHAHPLAVRAAVHVVEGVGHFAAVLGVGVAVLRRDDAGGQRVQAGVLQRHADAVARARGGAAVQGRGDAGGEEQGDAEVAQPVGGDERGVAAVHGGAEHAAARHVAGHVESGGVLFGALVAVSGHLGVHQLRELLVQRLVIQPHLDERLGAVAGQEDVGLGQKLHHDVHARLALQVERHELFAEVGVVERQVLVIGHGHVEHARLATRGIPSERLHLHDVGSPLRKHASGGGSGQVAGQIDDFDTLQWFHCYPPY